MTFMRTHRRIRLSQVADNPRRAGPLPPGPAQDGGLDLRDRHSSVFVESTGVVLWTT